MDKDKRKGNRATTINLTYIPLKYDNKDTTTVSNTFSLYNSADSIIIITTSM